MESSDYIVFYLWWKMYYDSADIWLNQNNARKMPLWRLPRKIMGCTQKWKMYIYSYMYVSFSWWCHRCAETKTPRYKYQQCPVMHIQKKASWMCAKITPLSWKKRGKAVYAPSRTMARIVNRYLLLWLTHSVSRRQLCYWTGPFGMWNILSSGHFGCTTCGKRSKSEWHCS